MNMFPKVEKPRRPPPTEDTPEVRAASARPWIEASASSGRSSTMLSGGLDDMYRSAKLGRVQ